MKIPFDAIIPEPKLTKYLLVFKPLEEGRNSHNSFFGLSQDWIVQKLDVKNQCLAILWLR